MFKKYINDNILNLILFDDKLFFDLYNTFEFKRLGRVGHLGMTYMFYPSSTHTRLSHSLGVYEITRRFLNHLKPETTNDTIIAIKVAALLHDLGHGIYSHLFEAVSVVNHEKYSIEIIKSKRSQVNQVLSDYSDKIIDEVVSILEGKHKLEWANQLISSEIDVDRLDYLKRDSIMTGTNYGQYNLDWIIKNSLIHQNKLVFHHKALPSIEQLILARYHMNQTIYNNVKNVANSQLFTFFIKRLEYLYKGKKLINNYKYLIPILEKRELTIDEFLVLDDYLFQHYLIKSLTENDKLLKIIATRMINQIPPKFVLGQEQIKELKTNKTTETYLHDWIILPIRTDFGEYQSSGNDEAIIFKDGKLEKIRSLSTVVKHSTTKSQKKEIGVFL